jgi:hypothetical protein
MWAAAADPRVLRARAWPVATTDDRGIDLASLSHCVRTGDGCEHVRLDLAGGVIRLDLAEGTVHAGPVSLEPAIDLGRALAPQLESIRRLVALLRGEVAGYCDRRLGRLVEALRAADALAAGASLRDIGVDLFSGEDWPGDGEYLKSRVRRRVDLAQELIRAGPRAVLHQTI